MKLSDRFGPIYLTTTLNGSGFGFVQFQPNGTNCRITNLFVKVATTTLQANCIVYKGQIADGNILSNTNSGSTGAPASGTIDLFDGETLFIVWRGGDAGAIATATIVGNTISFNDLGASTFVWADPIAAGDGSLIYPAIKSPNYVTGVSGWTIDRDGDVEFNDAVIRGTVEAGSNTVRLNSNGIAVIGTNEQYDVNKNAGFLARHNPDDGTQIQVFPTGVYVTSENPTPVNNKSLSPGVLFSGIDTVGAVDTPYTELYSQSIVGKGSAYIKLIGQDSASATNNSKIFLIGGVLPFSDDRNHDYMRGENGKFTISGGPAGSFVVAVTFADAFSIAPVVTTAINSGSGTTSGWGSRPINITTTGFDFFVFGASSTWVNVPVSWTAQEPT